MLDLFRESDGRRRQLLKASSFTVPPVDVVRESQSNIGRCVKQGGSSELDPIELSNTALPLRDGAHLDRLELFDRNPRAVADVLPSKLTL